MQFGKWHPWGFTKAKFDGRILWRWKPESRPDKSFRVWVDWLWFHFFIFR